MPGLSGGVSPPNHAARRTSKIRKIVAGPLRFDKMGGLSAGGINGKRPPKSGAGAVKPKVPRSPFKDQQFFSDLSAAAFKRDTEKNSLAAQEKQTELAYGFNTDPVTNPYSRAALMQKNYDNANKGSQNSMAAAGHLYSGALSNARAGNRANYNATYDEQRGAYDAELAKIRSARADAVHEYDLSITDASQSAIGRAAKDRPTASSAPAPKRGRKNKGDKKGGK